MQEDQTSQNTIAKLFNPAPTRWGLKGDKKLWEEMQETLKETEIPDSIFDFEEILYRVFMELTGENAKKRNNIYVERYQEDATSSGTVNSAHWVKTLFPLLLQRYRSEMY